MRSSSEEDSNPKIKASNSNSSWTHYLQIGDRSYEVLRNRLSREQELQCNLWPPQKMHTECYFFQNLEDPKMCSVDVNESKVASKTEPSILASVEGPIKVMTNVGKTYKNKDLAGSIAFRHSKPNQWSAQTRQALTEANYDVQRGRFRASRTLIQAIFA